MNRLRNQSHLCICGRWDVIKTDSLTFSLRALNTMVEKYDVYIVMMSLTFLKRSSAASDVGSGTCGRTERACGLRRATDPC